MLIRPAQCFPAWCAGIIGHSMIRLRRKARKTTSFRFSEKSAMRSQEFLTPMPLVCKRAKIMSEAYLTAARSGSASPEEIANRRKAIHNFIRARIADAATVDGGTLSQGFVKSGT